MNLILFSQREGRARQLNLAHPVTLGVVGVLALWILGLIAVFQPARRAAAVSPAEATRTA